MTKNTASGNRNLTEAQHSWSPGTNSSLLGMLVNYDHKEFLYAWHQINYDEWKASLNENIFIEWKNDFKTDISTDELIGGRV